MGVRVWIWVQFLGQEEGVAVAGVVVLAGGVVEEEGSTADLAGMESFVELYMEDIDLVEVVHLGENVAVRAVAVQVGGSGRGSVWLSEAVVGGLLWLLGAAQT